MPVLLLALLVLWDDPPPPSESPQQTTSVVQPAESSPENGKSDGTEANAGENSTPAVKEPVANGLSILRGWLTTRSILVLFVIFIVLLFLVGQVPLHYNLRNLVVRWRTSLVTALAFVLVIGLMTVMLAFVSGLRAITGNTGHEGNVLVLAEGANDEQFSNLGAEDASEIVRLDDIRRDPTTQSPMVSEELYVVVTQPIPVPPGAQRRRRFTQLRGMEDPALAAAVHELKLGEGEFFSQAGVQQTADGGTVVQAVLGQGIAAELGTDRPDKLPLQVGDTFPLGPRTWKVVGILQSAGTAYDSEVWAKRGLIGPMFGKSTISSIMIRTADADAATAFAKALRDKTLVKTALNAVPQKEYFEEQAQFSDVLLYCVQFIAFFMGIGGVFGVMNTMFAAISQRTKDIGVMRILGYRRRHILISFLLESLVLAAIGGAIGCLLGSFCDGLSAKSIVSSGQAAKTVVLRLSVDADIVLYNMLLSLTMGFIGGVFPALSAMRVRALESLR